VQQAEAEERKLIESINAKAQADLTEIREKNQRRSGSRPAVPAAGCRPLCQRDSSKILGRRCDEASAEMPAAEGRDGPAGRPGGSGRRRRLGVGRFGGRALSRRLYLHDWFRLMNFAVAGRRFVFLLRKPIPGR